MQTLSRSKRSLQTGENTTGKSALLSLDKPTFFYYLHALTIDPLHYRKELLSVFSQIFNSPGI
jgi:hypothetical protein